MTFRLVSSWPGLNADSVCNSDTQQFSPLNLPPLSSVIVNFTSSDDVNAYVASHEYASARAPALAMALELRGADMPDNVWTYAIRCNSSWIPHPSSPFPLTPTVDMVNRTQELYFTMNATDSRSGARFVRL